MRISLLLLLLAACRYDLGDVPRADGAQSTHPASEAGAAGNAGAADDAGAAGDAAESDRDARADEDAGAAAPDGDAAICQPATQRCRGDLLETCSEDGRYESAHDCVEAGCNPIAAACHACTEPRTDDGVLTCAHGRAEHAIPAYEVDTSQLTSQNQGSCGGQDAPEAIIEWIAPATDYWELDTAGSEYDTILYARDCSCGGDELGCNDDAQTGRRYESAAELVVRAERGQRIVVFLDGYGEESGRAVLNARRVSCPTAEVELGDLPATFNDRLGDGREAFRFVARETAIYAFRASSLTADGVRLCLHDGARCDDPPLACNESGDRYGAEVVRSLSAGQVVTIGIELGGDSPVDAEFELAGSELDPASCSLTPLDLGGEQPGSVPSGSHLLAPSCAPAGDARNDQNYRPLGFSEMRYAISYEPPQVCQVTVQSAFPAAVYLQLEACGGSEVACAVAMSDDSLGEGFSYSAQVSIPQSTQPYEYVLVVEPQGSNVSDPAEFAVLTGCVL